MRLKLQRFKCFPAIDGLAFQDTGIPRHIYGDACRGIMIRGIDKQLTLDRKQMTLRNQISLKSRCHYIVLLWS